MGIDPDDQFHFLGIYLPRKGKVDMTNPDGAFAHGIVFPAGVLGIQDEVDGKYVLIPLAYAGQLMEDSNRVSALEIRLNNPDKMDEAKEQIQEIIGDNFAIKNRFEQRESFYKVMVSEKTISFFILLFILIISAFNTVGSLYMLVIEKKNDLNVFSSMGLTGSKAALVFVYQSLLIAVIGGILGLLLGVGVILAQQNFGLVALQSTGSMMIAAYPVLLKWQDTFLVLITLIGLGLLTSIYPAYRASKTIEPEDYSLKTTSSKV